MSKVENVSYAKPSITGAISVAPKGSKLPTDAVSKLDPSFKTLGYINEDGLTNALESDSETIKAWGGDTVLVIKNGTEDTFTFKLIEILNVDVLKFVYGSKNVSGTLEEGITVKVNSKDAEEVTLAIDMILANDALKRIVIPNATISEIAEVEYIDNDAVGYEVTVLAKSAEEYDGDTHREFIKKSESDVPEEEVE